MGTAGLNASGSERSLPKAQLLGWLGIGGGLLLVVGSLLPWITATAPLIGTISRSGVSDGQSDGVFTLIVGAAAATVGGLTLLRVTDTKTAGWLLLIAALVGGGIGVVDFADVTSRISDMQAESDLVIGSIGMGLWVVLLGALVLAAGAIVALSKWTPGPPAQAASSSGNLLPPPPS